MSNDKRMTKTVTQSAKSNEEIYTGFQALRHEQRIMASKLSEMEAELNEHKIVIDTLKNVDPKRKCYRMVGGILCERIVQEVMPTLVTNKEQLVKVIETLNEQLIRKGTDINEYKEKHNIRVRGQDDIPRQEESKESKRNAVVINSIQA